MRARFLFLLPALGCAGTPRVAPTGHGPPPEYEEENTPNPNPTALPDRVYNPNPPSSTRERELTGAFASVNSDFSKCYDAELARTPYAKGRVLLRVVVSEVGLVTESRAIPGHSFSKGFEECVVAIPLRLKFGKSTTATAVTLPLDFARP
jgi:hypothetical protein